MSTELDRRMLYQAAAIAGLWARNPPSAEAGLATRRPPTCEWIATMAKETADAMLKVDEQTIVDGQR